MDYTIIFLIMLIIIVLQTAMFVSTLGKIRRFKSIFPNSASLSFYKRKEDIKQELKKLSEDVLEKRLIQENKTVEKFTKVQKTPSNSYNSSVSLSNTDETIKVLDKDKTVDFLISKIKGEISSTHKNKILSTILSAINDYIQNNKDAVSDFHLIKDIVDRNCDANEEDFQTQIPIPLYFGLGGTMLGILIGVGFFVFDGGLNALLNSTQTVVDASGIETLLGGVAIAMGSSFVGIFLTTIGSYIAKTAKSTVESNKHIFLTWIQAKLLPSLSNDTSSALIKMSQNLRAFNDTFSKNTGELGKTLENVNESYGLQKKLWDSIKEFADKDIQAVNLELFSTLKGSIGEIEKLGGYLQGVNQYQVKTTEAIEKMQNFFSKGIEQVDSININLNFALERFAGNSKKYVKALEENLDGQILDIKTVSDRQQTALQKHINDMFDVRKTTITTQEKAFQEYLKNISDQMKKSASEQQEIFKQKVDETTILVEELKNLSAVKSSLSELVKATNDQKHELTILNQRIEQLAQIKAIGGEIKVIQHIPRTIKLAAIIGGSIISLACLMYILPSLINLVKNLFN